MELFSIRIQRTFQLVSTRINRSQYAERIVKVVRSDERAAGLRFVGLPIRTCHFDPVGNHGVQVQPLAAVRGLQG